MNVAHNESNGFFFTISVVVLTSRFGRKLALKTHNAEMPPPRGKISFGKFAD